MIYLILKWIHILSATIMFGTGIGSAFYIFMANRSKDTASIYFATRNVVIADFVFTTPAVIIQLLSGIGLMHLVGYSFADTWVLWGFVLYVFACACWLPVVWMQIKMRDMAKEALQSHKPLPDTYWRMDAWWIILGSLALPVMVIIFWLMVAKPS